MRLFPRTYAMLLHPSVDLLLADNCWLDEEVLDSQYATLAAVRGLKRAGLFTSNLSALGQGEVSVELIYQGPAQEVNERLNTLALVRRDVVIRVGRNVAAVASTIIKDVVMAQYPWLTELGNQPIGEALERRIGAIRADIHYCAIDQNDPLNGNFPDATAAWGRQYRYLFNGGDLRITEVISDTVLQAIAELA